jgi:predicted AlkP superfamily pyrophosphatase or phosphodiesterase
MVMQVTRLRQIGLMLGAALGGLAAPALAQAPASPALGSPATPPKLLIVISVDQFSGDLFSEYRAHFTGGLARLANEGLVFPKGYQSHAATETCPGHSTILTGSRPARTGIIANNWIDQSVARPEKLVYCAEDPATPGSSARDYAASPIRLKVPTLGDYMKSANPAAQVVSVAGKDRAAIMMGGRKLDEIWWWSSKGFTSYKGTAATPLVTQVNAGIAQTLNQDRVAMPLPPVCAPRAHPVSAGAKTVVGTGQFARKAGDARGFRASPEADAAVLVLATSMIEARKLGRGTTTDLISIGLSATDYVGHSYGTGGAEMCLQMLSLDRELGAFFGRLDASGVDYMVTLTADHGGHDLPERLDENAAPDAQRVDKALYSIALSKAIAAKTGLSGELILSDGPFGDMYVRKDLSVRDKARVMKEALGILRTHPQVQTVFTHAELTAAPAPAGPPESWTLLTMAKAGFDPERSGDLVVFLKPRVTPIADPDGGYVATHGSPWDYDRRVPIVFWRKGMTPFEQPLGMETVDILPTLAAQIGLSLGEAKIDGRCLDLLAGKGTSCR